MKRYDSDVVVVKRSNATASSKHKLATQSRHKSRGGKRIGRCK